ncbi:prepilin-type N-terminal cleavage/methylation domain-containing protein [candidate division WWE3 bacterium]|nr:prepilin-type N-terminal cleavage/methylation domain-containing protein [candidate division WWE3 bacterium]
MYKNPKCKIELENAFKTTVTQPQYGFTLIEILLVISMIGVLSAISVSLINPKSSSGKARDGVRIANVKSISESIESYRQVEGSFPATSDATTATSELRKVYLRKWPEPISDEGSLDATNWSYVYFNTGSDGFLVYSPNSLGGCYKYQSDWGKVMTCPISECKSEFSLVANCN